MQVSLNVDSGSTFAPSGRTPRAGEVWSSEGHAHTLELIGSTNARAFYEGEIADRILAAADGEGNMISYIQSNYMGFGARVVVPGTGISLQNRGHSFSLDPSHANVLAPGKRPFHTIIPGFLTLEGAAVGPFGIMGGHMQPQAHVQVLMNAIDFNLNPQAALDAPRWQWVSGKTVQVEPGFPQHIAEALARRGHHIQRSVDSGGFGRGQIIWRDGTTGVLCGGTEPRTDGHIALW